MLENNNEYWGRVVNVDDETRSGKIKVAVQSVFDQLQTEHIPWAEPMNYGRRTHDLPELNSIVFIKFEDGDIYRPRWYEIRGNSNEQNLSDEDYPSATILIDKDLSKYNSDGRVTLKHSLSGGIELTLIRGGNTSSVSIRPDNSIIFQNGNTGKVVHISNESISLGSETSSAEPGVLGDANETALNNLNNTIRDLTNIMITGLTTISSVAAASTFTAPLAAPITQLFTDLQTNSVSLYNENNIQIPETKSEIVTLD